MFKNLYQLKYQLFNKFVLTKLSVKKNFLIDKFFIGKILLINVGNKNLEVLCKSNLIGNKIGSLIFTKKMGANIHQKKKKKKIKKKKNK